MLLDFRFQGSEDMLHVGEDLVKVAQVRPEASRSDDGHSQAVPENFASARHSEHRSSLCVNQSGRGFVCVWVCVCVCVCVHGQGDVCIAGIDFMTLNILFGTSLILAGRLETHLDFVDDCIRLARQCQLLSLVSLIEDTLKKTLDFRKFCICIYVFCFHEGAHLLCSFNFFFFSICLLCFFPFLCLCLCVCFCCFPFHLL